MTAQPLTTEEAKAEFDYRLKERIYMMSPDGKPTKDQLVYAQMEAMREVRLLRAANDQAHPQTPRRNNDYDKRQSKT